MRKTHNSANARKTRNAGKADKVQRKTADALDEPLRAQEQRGGLAGVTARAARVRDRDAVRRLIARRGRREPPARRRRVGRAPPVR